MNGRRLLLCAALTLLGTGAPVRAADGLPTAVADALVQAAALADPGERAVRLSARLLGTPYQAHTLVGSAATPEQLTIRFDAVDCFTFLDVVEALRRAGPPGEFRQRLVEVRYRDGVIAWPQRRHFFTDWAAAPDGRVADVTAAVGGRQLRQAAKQLNRKADGTLHLPGVPVQARTIGYVPGAAIDASVLGRLRSGDYLGIYSPAAGLDVSHVGIVVRTNGRLLLRHASSRREAGQVVDSDLVAYLAGKPGIVVLRPQ